MTNVKDDNGSDKIVGGRKISGCDLVFRHFTLPVKNTKKKIGFDLGRVCVALLRPKKDSGDTTYRAAVAFGMPSDSENRRKARDIAYGRLVCDRPGRSFTFNIVDEEAKNFKKIFDVALDIATDPDFSIPKNNRLVNYAPAWVQSSLDDGYEFTKI